jgi:hypothetical protein
MWNWIFIWIGLLLILYTSFELLYCVWHTKFKFGKRDCFLYFWYCFLVNIFLTYILEIWTIGVISDANMNFDICFYLLMTFLISFDILSCFLTYILEIWTRGVIYDTKLSFDIRWPTSDTFDTIWPIFLCYDLQTQNLDQGCNFWCWIEF